MNTFEMWFRTILSLASIVFAVLAMINNRKSRL